MPSLHASSTPTTDAPSGARNARPAGGQDRPIRILLATYNGAAHLHGQLESFVTQSHANWELLVSDDGSRDATRALLHRFAEAHPGRVAGILEGPGRGSAQNFLSLLARSVADRPDAAVAFSDQDDVWLPGKLARAAAWLATPAAQGAGPADGAEGRSTRADAAVAGWVCRTVLTNPALVPIGESRRFARPMGFGNALVQNILAGNTLVLSPGAARAVAATVPAASAADVPYHDWWVYQVLTGLGAPIGMEEEPLVLYRQHGANHMGHHGPLSGRLKRLKTVAGRDYSGWLDANLAALSDHARDLTPEARWMLRGFQRARARGGRFLTAALPRFGLYRQTSQGDRLIRMMARAGRL